MSKLILCCLRNHYPNKYLFSDSTIFQRFRLEVNFRLILFQITSILPFFCLIFPSGTRQLLLHHTNYINCGIWEYLPCNTSGSNVHGVLYIRRDSNGIIITTHHSSIKIQNFHASTPLSLSLSLFLSRPPQISILTFRRTLTGICDSRRCYQTSICRGHEERIQEANSAVKSGDCRP